MPDGVETVMLPIKVSQEENHLNLCQGVRYEGQVHLVLWFTLISRVSNLEYHTRNFQSVSVHKEFQLITVKEYTFAFKNQHAYGVRCSKHYKALTEFSVGNVSRGCNVNRSCLPLLITVLPNLNVRFLR